MAAAPHSNDLAWESIPGAYETDIAFIVRADDTAPGCNTILLRSHEYAIVVDPGADTDRADGLALLLETMTREMPRQAMVCLTHCHAGHSLAASRILDKPGLIASLVCHKLAADALRQGDAVLTGAAILGTTAPRAASAIALFALPTCTGVARDMLTPGGPLRCVTIPIGPRDALQVYHTPGHSPDGLCFRMGGALMLGDILDMDEKARPALPGSDREELLRTLSKLAWLMDHANIVAAYPGHGAPLDRTEVFRRIEFLRRNLN